MANLNQYLLLTAMIFASCTIMLVHVFVFPLYDTKMTKARIKLIGDFEQSLCMTNTRRLAKGKKHKCPSEGIVTVSQGGRLGNQIWEYASVWGVSRVTGLIPYVPRCIRHVLDAVFVNLSIPPLYKVAHCNVQWNSGSLDSWNGTSILLPRFVVMPDLVLTWTQDIRKELKFKPKLYENAQNIMRNFANTMALIHYYYHTNGSIAASASTTTAFVTTPRQMLITTSPMKSNSTIVKPLHHLNSTWFRNLTDLKRIWAKRHNVSADKSLMNPSFRRYKQNLTYVGVHVRRTDYKGYLWRTRKMNLVDAGYFHRAMNYFRKKYKNVGFVIVSDESSWCEEHLNSEDVLVIQSRTSSPGLDLALMASCNHSIIDYGTFGVWGAILAGGETVLYNISRHSSVRVAQLLPGWHVMS